jgi:hypothetical protein
MSSTIRRPRTYGFYTIENTRPGDLITYRGKVLLRLTTPGWDKEDLPWFNIQVANDKEIILALHLQTCTLVPFLVGQVVRFTGQAFPWGRDPGDPPLAHPVKPPTVPPQQ